MKKISSILLAGIAALCLVSCDYYDSKCQFTEDMLKGTWSWTSTNGIMDPTAEAQIEINDNGISTLYRLQSDGRLKAEIWNHKIVNGCVIYFDETGATFTYKIIYIDDNTYCIRDEQGNTFMANKLTQDYSQRIIGRWTSPTFTVQHTGVPLTDFFIELKVENDVPICTYGGKKADNTTILIEDASYTLLGNVLFVDNNQDGHYCIKTISFYRSTSGMVMRWTVITEDGTVVIEDFAKE